MDSCSTSFKGVAYINLCKRLISQLERYEFQICRTQKIFMNRSMGLLEFVRTKCFVHNIYKYIYILYYILRFERL